jgi:endoglucanase
MRLKAVRPKTRIGLLVLLAGILTAAEAFAAVAPPTGLRILVDNTPVNQPPTVSAGSNQTITLPALASLNGTASDDGLPSGSKLTTTWSKFNGPGTVTFGNLYARSTTASFSAVGSYVLRLTANDGSLSNTANVTITVNATPTVTTPIGINTSEAEYSWGSFPGTSDLAYLKSKKITLIRLPIAWERAQTKLNGPLDATYLGALKAFINAAGAEGMQVIVDVHNYGRYNKNWAQDAAANYGYVAVGKGDVIGSAAVPISAFADLWTKLAAALKGTPGLGYYGLMNEPHDMGGTNVWPAAAQAAVNAIRAIDMNTSLLVAGTQWSSARWWPSDNGNLHITDPANKLLYEAHLYFDSDGSGRYLQSYAQSGAYPMIGADRLQPFLTWLKQNNAKGFLGEFGIPNNDPQWLAVLDNFLTALQAAGLSGTYWNYVFHSPSDPDWWPVNDPMSIRIDNGQANPQMDILLKHNTAK